MAESATTFPTKCSELAFLRTPNWIPPIHIKEAYTVRPESQEMVRLSCSEFACL